jgi:hypothetical protein
MTSQFPLFHFNVKTAFENFVCRQIINKHVERFSFKFETQKNCTFLICFHHEMKSICKIAIVIKICSEFVVDTKIANSSSNLVSKQQIKQSPRNHFFTCSLHPAISFKMLTMARYLKF